jgi:hypothetical protein
MSATERLWQDITPAEAHAVVVEDYTARYLHEGRVKPAYALPYDPQNPLCDYERASWAAKPNWKLGLPAAKVILGKMHGLDQRQINGIIGTFQRRAPAITASQREFPLMNVNGHNPNMQTAFSNIVQNIAMARLSRGWFGSNLDELSGLSHVIGTRAFAALVVGYEGTPVSLPLVSVSQTLMTPHLSIPDNQKMRAGRLPRSFKSAYNDIFVDEVMDVIEKGTAESPNGLYSSWHVAPNATPDVDGHSISGREIKVTAKVGEGTTRLVQAMGVGIQPVLTSFGFKKRPTFVELGDIIPPDEVNDQTLPNIMADLALYRRMHGEAVYYAEEPEVLPKAA